MTITYEPNSRCLKVSGVKEEIPFYCGDTLDNLALTLIQLKHRDMSIQDAYIYLSKWMLDSALKGDMVLWSRDGEMLLSLDSIVPPTK